MVSALGVVQGSFDIKVLGKLGDHTPIDLRHRYTFKKLKRMFRLSEIVMAMFLVIYGVE